MITTDWFKHDANARKDDKLSAIRVRFGLVGYALYFILLEIMRNKNEFKIKTGDIQTITALEIIPFTKNGNDRIDLKEFLDFCCTDEVRAFRFRENKKNPDESYYYSSGFRKRMEALDRGRRRMSNGGKLGAKMKYGSDSEEVLRDNYGDEEFEIAKRVIQCFNHETGKNFKVLGYSVKLIVDRLKEGFTEKDCLQVIKNKKNSRFLREHEHLNIKTFFSPDKFESYLLEKSTISESEKQGNYVPED